MNLHLRLTLDVKYETHGVDVELLKEWLRRVPNDDYAEGRLTYTTDAEIEEYLVKVEEIPCGSNDIQ
jgi:hypothetical protein